MLGQPFQPQPLKEVDNNPVGVSPVVWAAIGYDQLLTGTGSNALRVVNAALGKASYVGVFMKSVQTEFDKTRKGQQDIVTLEFDPDLTNPGTGIAHMKIKLGVIAKLPKTEQEKFFAGVKKLDPIMNFKYI